MATLLTNGQLPHNPCSLGVIKPTAGTPLPCTNNYTDLNTRPFHAVNIQALGTNSGGNVYVLDNSSPADVVNFLNVIAVLFPGQSYTANSYAMNSIFAGLIYLDVDGTGDGAVVSVTET